MMAQPARGGKKRSRLQRIARKLHRWAGLTALAWLIVLGGTGLVLDHDEWRWARQLTVPADWLSDRVARLLPATLMRYVAVDPADPQRWLGASERGMWRSEDGGASWQRVPFEGVDRAPQVEAFVERGQSGLGGIWLATDDGLWKTTAEGASAVPVAIRGAHVVSLTPDAEPRYLLGLLHHARMFRFDTRRGEVVDWIDVDAVEVEGLENDVPFSDFVFDLHFGYGLFNRTASTWINDFGGAALVILGTTGLLFWWLPRRWRKGHGGFRPRRKHRIYSWLYRSHGPVIGLLAALPILYFSVTGILLDHVFWLLDWGTQVTIERENLPPVYRYDSLHGEIDAVVAYPDAPGEMTVSTRLGILHTRDSGKTWQREQQLPASNGRLFRHEDVVFASWTTDAHFFRRDGEPDWRSLNGLTTGISGATRVDSTWYVKNSRGLHGGLLGDEMKQIEFAPPPLDGATLYLFFVDLHTGNVFHPQFIWVNDLVSLLAIVLVVTGPIIWWRKKWL